MTSTNPELTALNTFEWTQDPWFPTKRHTVPRQRTVTSTVELGIPIIAPEDAPIAYLQETTGYDYDRRESFPGPTYEIRVYGDKLWWPYGVNHRDYEPIAATEKWLSSLDLHAYITAAEETSAMVQQIRALQDQHIIVDGIVWGQTVEPVYHVETPTPFSRGPRHVSMGVTRPHTEDGHATSESYFPADQREEAISYAAAIAESDGCLFDEATIRATPNIEVTGAHSPGTTWTPAPRLTYTMPEWNASPIEYADQLKNFRASIGDNYHTILIPAEDGFGNRYVIVDRTKLTHTQAWHYDQMLEKAGDPAAPRQR